MHLHKSCDNTMINYHEVSNIRISKELIEFFSVQCDIFNVPDWGMDSRCQNVSRYTGATNSFLTTYCIKTIRNNKYVTILP